MDSKSSNNNSNNKSQIWLISRFAEQPSAVSTSSDCEARSVSTLPLADSSDAENTHTQTHPNTTNDIRQPVTRVSISSHECNSLEQPQKSLGRKLDAVGSCRDCQCFELAAISLDISMQATRVGSSLTKHTPMQPESLSGASQAKSVC